MSYGSQVYNQGIAHISFQAGGHPFCKSMTAHIVCAVADAHTEPRLCKRCEAKLEKMRAVSAKRAAKLETAI